MLRSTGIFTGLEGCLELEGLVVGLSEFLGARIWMAGLTAARDGYFMWVSDRGRC